MNFELDEFDEMAFGLGPQAQQTSNAQTRKTVEDPMQFLNSREPPQLRIPPKTAPTSTISTKIPLDGLFSDEDDDLFPAFHGSSSVASKPKTATAAAPLSRTTSSELHEESTENAISGLNRSFERQNSGETTSISTKPVTASILDRLAPKSPVVAVPDNKQLSGGNSILGSVTDSSSALGRLNQVGKLPAENSVLRTPVKSSLFKNLVAPPWEKQNNPADFSGNKEQISQPDSTTTLSSNPLIEKAETERQRRAMIFGGSNAATPSTVSVSTTPIISQLPPSIQQEIPQITKNSEDLINKVLQETKEAEEEDHRRVSSHHDFIRQQTQKTVQLQQNQADEFLKEYLAENKKQLDSHLFRLRSSFPLLQSANAKNVSGNEDFSNPEMNSERRITVFSLEKKVEILERKLEDRDAQLASYNALIIGLEDQHREEIRELRTRFDEAQQRAAQTHHEYVVSLLANQESGRKQYEEALSSLRDAVSTKSSVEVVRGTVEQSAREFAIWRTELEQKNESLIKEKDEQLRLKEYQIAELTNMLERQNEKSRIERDVLQQRVQDDTSRLLKRQSEVEEQSYALQRERLEFESERKNFHNLQAKEMQRLEKKMEETLRERHTALETLAEDRHTVEEDRRKISETIRAAEEKYALDYKKRQLILDSAMETVTVEKRLIEEKNRNVDREIAALNDERSRLERDKKEVTERKSQLDKYNEELQKRDIELEQTTLRVAKIKREGDLALHEAKFMDEEHKNRVAKFNAFLEQLRDKELNLMRQAVADPDGEYRQRAAIQLPNGSLTVVPHRTTPGVAGGTRMQLIPNPARDTRYWQGERDYLQVLDNTPWNTKKTT